MYIYIYIYIYFANNTNPSECANATRHLTC